MAEARHVMHGPTAGEDRIRAWEAATGEPVFVWGSGWSAGRTTGAVRRSFRGWLKETGEAGLTVYHDGPGADFLGTWDSCERKVLFLHSWPPRWERAFDYYIRCSGKVITGSEAGRGLVRGQFGWIPERYLAVVPEPSGNAMGSCGKREHGRRCGIWLRGRNWRPLGNRLRALVDRWEEADGDLEILVGSGSVPRWARKAGVRWCAGESLASALERVDQWDSVLLLQDFDLEAPWILRALAGGSFAVVPDGEGREAFGNWQAEAAPRPYAWGDAAAALERLREWRSADEAERAIYRHWAAETVAGREPNKWRAQSWQPVVRTFTEQRAPRLRRRRGGARWVPVFWVERLQRLRSGWG